MKKKFFGDSARKHKSDLIKEKKWNYLQKRYRLCERELQVVKLICEGLTNNEISQKLNIMPGTVKTHLGNIYRRVRVSSKFSMFLRFIEDAGISII